MAVRWSTQSPSKYRVYTNRVFVRPYRKPDGTYDYENGLAQYGFFFDPKLKANVENYLIPAVKKDWDGVVIFSGMVGSGKSSLATTVAYFIDPNFSVNNIVFTQDQLEFAIDNMPKESVIVMDEAILSMYSQDAATEAQKVLMKKFVTCRKRNLYIFLVMPSIFSMRKFWAVQRTRALVHTASPDGIRRGWFKFYGWESKRKLFMAGYKDMDMGAVKPDFFGRFVDTFGMFFDANAYDAKKEETIRRLSMREQESALAVPRMVEKVRQERDFMTFISYGIAKFMYQERHVADRLKRDREFNLGKFRALLMEKYGYSPSLPALKQGLIQGLEFIKKNKEQNLKEKEALGLKQ